MIKPTGRGNRPSMLTSPRTHFPPLAAGLIAAATLYLGTAPAARAETGAVVVIVHSDDAAVAPATIRQAVAAELHAPVVALEDPAAREAKTDVTVTYRRATAELAVTVHDAKRGTVTRVVPAPGGPREIARAAALLTGSLARSEADELLAGDARPGDPAAAPSAPPPSTAAADVPPASTGAPPPDAHPSVGEPDGAPLPNRAREHHVSVAVLGGYGVNDSNAAGGTPLNVWGAGVGARAGYTFGFGLYLGAGFAYHTGFSKTVDGNSAFGRVMPFGAEVGYALGFGPLTLRPYVGGGAVTYSAQAGSAASFDKGTGQKPAFWPGAVATVDLTEHLFVGADARYTVVLIGADDSIVGAGHGTANALETYATLGFRIPGI